MAFETTTATAASAPLQAAKVYGVAVLCLMTGLAIGYLLEGSASSAARTQPGPASTATSNAGNPARGAAASGMGAASETIGRQGQSLGGAAPASPHGGVMGSGGRMPTLDEMKQMADKQAAPMLEKLKTDPGNTALLRQVGAIYHSTHQFKQAAEYYEGAVKTDPTNVALRTSFAASLYRSGDVDGAIAQLNRALSYSPNDANALFNLGLIRLQGKQDGKGALRAWQQLLKTNPQMSTDRRDTVQKLMANVMTTLAEQHATEAGQKQ